jgi:hypothetical protein
LNPDLATAFNGDTNRLTSHYLNYGINEGRAPCVVCKYSTQGYLNANPDLRAGGVNNDVQALSHYKNYGNKEGRAICLG